MLFLFLLAVFLACHSVCFTSETGMIPFFHFGGEFLGGCCCCLGSDFLSLFTFHLPFCKFFSPFFCDFLFLFKVDRFVYRGQGGVGVCSCCFSLGLFPESFSIFVLFGVPDSLCLSLRLFVSASLGFLAVA